MTVTETRPTTPSPPPDARRQPYRRDVQGLRAIAVVAVVLFHAGVPWLPGGYVGVDVFFVVSGFVITGSLLGHHERTGHVSLLSFYGRRAQRILPLAATVLIATVVATYALLGFVQGARVAHDAAWASVFLANVHQAQSGSTYLGSQLDPSLVQHFWSLAVEEQFYLVWPLLVLVTAGLSHRARWKPRLALVTATVVVISVAWSVVETAHGGSWAYYSPLTRAWELGLGAGCALAVGRLRGLSSWFRGYLTVLGLAAIALSAVVFSSATPFPGIAAALPTLGAVGVIVGGSGSDGRVSTLLGGGVMVFVGDISYSLYLWHWPVLIIAERTVTHPLGAWTRVALVVGAVALSVVTHRLVERPLHHARVLRRQPGRSLATGALLVTAVLVTATVAVRTHPRVTDAPSTALTGLVSSVTEAEVEQAVEDAARTTRAPDDLVPSVGAPSDGGASLCTPTQVGGLPVCVSGDPTSDRIMAVYGDSHADEWTFALSPIATRAHLKLISFALPSCPAVDLSLYSFETNAPNTACDAWHAAAPAVIASLDPVYTVLASSGHAQAEPDGTPVSASKWEAGLRSTISAVRSPGTSVVVLGDYAYLPQPAPDCVAAHADDVLTCSTTLAAQADLSQRDAEQAAARAEQVQYVDTLPWVCAERCPAVVGNHLVYKDSYHLTAAYTEFLSGPLAAALRLDG